MDQVANLFIISNKIKDILGQYLRGLKVGTCKRLEKILTNEEFW